MLIPKVGLLVNYVLNNTGIEWFEFQDLVQKSVDTALHCLPKNKMDLLLEAQAMEKYPDLYFEIWGCVRDFQMDIAIVRVNKPEEDEED